MHCARIGVPGNPLSGVPESIHNCKALMFVNFQETEIVSLPAEMCRLPRLTDLSLSQKTLKPKLANAYNAGTRRLMEYLARKDEKRDLKQQLTQRFRIDVRLSRILRDRCACCACCACCASLSMCGCVFWFECNRGCDRCTFVVVPLVCLSPSTRHA
jgi:hypothetical protein